MEPVTRERACAAATGAVAAGRALARTAFDPACGADAATPVPPEGLPTVSIRTAASANSAATKPPASE